MNHTLIKHSGTIKTIHLDSVEVCILNHSACSSCHSKGACGMTSDSAEKFISVPAKGHNYSVGDTVQVMMSQSQGFYALFLAYLLPCIILIITLIVSLEFTNELQAGIYSLLILVPYYATLFLFKKNLKQKISYELEKI